MSDKLAASAAAGAIAAGTQKEVIGAQIVTKTLDTMNKYGSKNKKNKTGSGDIAASYDFNKSVLSAVYNPTGAIADLES